MPGVWREQQQGRETASAAGSAARAKHSLFTTSLRSAKAASDTHCRTSKRCVEVATKRNTGGNGGRRVASLHYPALAIREKHSSRDRGSFAACSGTSCRTMRRR